jgi:hypothetical protein
MSHRCHQYLWIASAIIIYVASYCVLRARHHLVHRNEVVVTGHGTWAISRHFVGMPIHGISGPSDPVDLSYHIFTPLRLLEGFAWTLWRPPGTDWDSSRDAA